MKTYKAIIKIVVKVEANDEDEAFEQAVTWFQEEPFPDYDDIEVNEIPFLDFDNIIASNERK